MGRTSRRERRTSGPSVPSRRWPWALAATAAGALAGACVAYAVRRVEGQDNPGAVEPEQLVAVVDRPDDDNTAAPDGPDA
jgi:hypothetical protein